MRVIERKQRCDGKKVLYRKKRFSRRTDGEIEIEKMKLEIKKKGFEFRRNEIVKPDERGSVKLPQLKKKKLMEEP